MAAWVVGVAVGFVAGGGVLCGYLALPVTWIVWVCVTAAATRGMAMTRISAMPKKRNFRFKLFHL